MPYDQAPLTITIDVQWSEMDALGHVNNARFFTWFESARIALFARIGVATSRPAQTGPILATTTCDFLKPVVFPAKLAVSVSVTGIGETSLTMGYEVKDAAGSTIYARGTSVAVLVDYASMKKVRVPDDVRAAIGAL